MSRPAPTDDALDPLAPPDPDLAAVLAGSGRPMVPVRPADFATLLLIVTEQMLSIHAAMAIWRRLEALGPVTLAHFQTHDDDALLAIGFSRAKLRYGRGLAAALMDGSLDLGALAALPDADAMRALTALRTGKESWRTPRPPLEPLAAAQTALLIEKLASVGFTV